MLRNLICLKDFGKYHRAKEISAFVNPDGLYHKIMPFGMKNYQATFQHLVNSFIFNLAGSKGYIDGAIIFSKEWEWHLQTIRNFFDRLSEAKLTVNLTKSEFDNFVSYCGTRSGETCRS